MKILTKSLTSDHSARGLQTTKLLCKIITFN